MCCQGDEKFWVVGEVKLEGKAAHPVRALNFTDGAVVYQSAHATSK